MNNETPWRKELRKRYWRSEKGKATRRRGHRKERMIAKMECLLHYGGNPPKCACCGEANIGFLTLDHVNNDGVEHRRPRAADMQITLKKAGFPADPPIQVLCYNCNCGRENNNGVCPHKSPVDWTKNRKKHRQSAPLPLFP